MKTKQQLWLLHVSTEFNGNEWIVSITASEESVLIMLRSAYGALELQLREVAKAPGAEQPEGLIDEALALLRCLLFGKLEPINGKHINLSRN